MSNPALLALARRNLGGGDVHLGRSTTSYGTGLVFARSNASAYTEHKPGMDHSMHKKDAKKDSSPKKKRKAEDDGSGSESDDDESGPKKKKGIFKKGEDADGDGKTGEGKNKKMDWKDRNKNDKPDGFEKK